ncbi:MAG: CBS domain-containing protein, partial [Nonomuraea sp.]|nr:CBS domain-containing protein [Nonomuraea sp.]
TRGVSGLPVVDGDGRVVGVVSESDLLTKEEFKEVYRGEGYQPPVRARLRRSMGSEGSAYRKAKGETAGELMTAPACTTTPDAPVVLAARLMDRHGIKRLPVVDDSGRLVGIVSRRDLLKVFLRRDEDIRAQVLSGLPLHTMWSDGKGLVVQVREGVVTLAGKTDQHSEAVTAVQMAESLDGVVGVRDELTWKHDDLISLPAMWGGA